MEHLSSYEKEDRKQKESSRNKERKEERGDSNS